MDNKNIATLLYETADLMEINGDDSFRIRSYRRAGEAIESLGEQVEKLICEPKKMLEVPGIGRGMLANLQEICEHGDLTARRELLSKYRPSMLELLKISGLGPKTIALLWSAFQVADLDGVEKLAKEGKIRTLPRMGEKQEQKILKSIADYKRIAGRFLIDEADRTALKLIDHMKDLAGVEKITPAGSLRRGRETVGDLDILVTGEVCENDAERQAAIEHILRFPGIMDVLAKGDNKVSFRLRSGMQVDVRLLPRDSFGAAMQYFTGSKSHNVTLRQRALKMGLTLNEYGLAQLEGGARVAGKTESEIYQKLGLEYIPPELRENCGEIEAAEENRLPELITQQDIQGDVHMHTVETDGRNTIEEMAEAALERGYKYMAITDHSKNLAMANGLDDERALAHIKKIHAANQNVSGNSHLRWNRSRYPCRRHSRSFRFCACRDGPGDRQRSLTLQSGTAADDRSPVESRQQSTCINRRSSDRTSSSSPRCLRVRHGSDSSRSREEPRRHGTECVSRPARLERRSSPHGQGSRRENRDQHGFAPYLAPGKNPFWDFAGATCMADQGGRPEYASCGGLCESDEARLAVRTLGIVHLTFCLLPGNWA